eukprot:m.320345 g.320345  ORF g.320345 m.320345 type:complete len:204 (+) comp23964_c0_seq1:154-765(+)
MPSTLLSLALCLVAVSAFAAAKITPVSSISVPAYLGRWFQMYDDLSASGTYERNAVCVAADYGLINSTHVSVFNSERTGTVDGPRKNITGYAEIKDPKKPAELTVYLSGVPVPAPYWIIELGPQIFTNTSICPQPPCYDYAIVSDGFGISLFVLARDVATFRAKYDEGVRRNLTALGFDKFFNKPEPTLQSPDCDYPPLAKLF